MPFSADPTICQRVTPTGATAMDVSRADAKDFNTERQTLSPSVGEEAVNFPCFCPLCFRRSLRRPALLHPPPKRGRGNVCLACEDCVLRWRSIGASGDTACRSQCPQCATHVDCSGASVVPFSCGENELVANAAPDKDGEETIMGRSMTRMQETLCGICEEMNAEKYCVSCGFPLCDACQESSHQRGQYRTHQVISLQEAKRQKTKMCKEHTSQVLDLYCFTCSTSVCLSCCFGGNHRGHTVEPVEDVAEKIRCTVKEKAESLRQLGLDFQDVALRFKNQMTQPYERRFAMVQEEIHKCFDTLRKTLEERESHLQQQLLDHASHVRSGITRYTSQGEIFYSTIQHTVLSLEKEFLSCMGAADMINFKDTVMRSLDALESVSAHVFTNSNAVLRAMEERLTRQDGVASFSFSHSDEFLKHVDNVGSLHLPSIPSPLRALRSDITSSASLSLHHEAKEKIIENDVDAQTQQRSLPPLMGQQLPRELQASPSSLTATATWHELQIGWSSNVRSNGDTTRATVPSLIVPSISTQIKAPVAVNNPFVTAEKVQVTETRKRFHGHESREELNKEEAMMRPPYKQHKKVAPNAELVSGVRSLVLPKHTSGQEDGVSNPSSSSGTMTKGNDKTASGEQGTNLSSLSLQLNL